MRFHPPARAPAGAAVAIAAALATAAAVALVLFPTAALAASPVATSTSAAPAPPPMQSVTVSGKHRIALPARASRVSGAEAQAVTGQYDLADGRTLTVAGRAGHLTAEMNGVPKVALVAASSSRYVARNQHLELEFDQAENGLVSGVVVTWLAPVETRGHRRARQE